MAARRTVSVALEVKAAVARREIRGASDDVRKLEASVVATGRGLAKMADEAGQAGRAAEKMAAGERVAKAETAALNRELGQLDRQIDSTALHLKMLQREFAATGDKGLAKQIRADQAWLRMLQSVRKGLAPEAPDVPKAPGGGLPMMPVAIGAAAVIGAALLPSIGAAVGGAVLGGIGTGGIVGGIVAGAQDGRVQDAFKAMGGRLGKSLTESGQSFIGPLLSNLSQIEAAANSGINILRKGFEDLAPVLTPLVHGLDGFVTQIGPGLGRAFEAAKPALRALANELPEIGAALSDMFDSIADEGDGATMGLLAMLHAIEWLIRATGSFIGTMSGIFEWLVRTGNATTEWGLKVIDVAEAFAILGGPIAMSAVDAAQSHLTSLNTETDHLISGLDKANDSSGDFSRSVEGTADSAEEAAAKVKDLADAIDDLFHKQMSWDQAQIAVRDGMRDLIKELTDGARTLSKNSEEGDKNRKAILSQIGALEDLRDAQAAQTGNLAEANRVYGANLEQLRKSLLALGYNKDAVNAMINAYKNIPVRASTTVETPGLAVAQSRLKSIENTLNRLDGETTYHRFVTVYDAEYRAGERNPTGRASGGPTTAGRTYWVGERGPELWEETSNGYMHDAASSRAMTSAGFTRAGAGGTQTVVHEHRHVLVVEGTGVLSGLRQEIGLLGGDVQSALGSRTRVGG